ncbi:hypothetical protein HPB48_007231 [Haemaphysalis longicornis]|uniref:Uncharacterized protein n=1 Tax=Haemaphysalis longicornis TaxID=44386 RepID=A0A9J6GZA8_HAELO|nr:hypothetical protein HPB48_007231 [Haemaphysalis longicornis]
MSIPLPTRLTSFILSQPLLWTATLLRQPQFLPPLRGEKAVITPAMTHSLTRANVNDSKVAIRNFSAGRISLTALAIQHAQPPTHATTILYTGVPELACRALATRQPRSSGPPASSFPFMALHPTTVSNYFTPLPIALLRGTVRSCGAIFRHAHSPTQPLGTSSTLPSTLPPASSALEEVI